MQRPAKKPRPAPLPVLAVAVAALLLLAASGSIADPLPEIPFDPQAAELESRYWNDVAPVLDTYCAACHGPDKQKSGVRFDTILTLEDAIALSDDLAAARDMLADRQMPPDDEPAPSDHETLTVQQWLDDALSYVPPDAAIDPGWFIIHRLNRAEYTNTLRDLLHIDASDLADRLPPDDTGYGFDNIAAVLTMSPLLLEAYLDAAEHALERALGPVVVPSTRPRPLVLRAPEKGGRATETGGVFLFSNGAAGADTTVPADAEYEITVRAWGTMGGDEPPRLSLRVDGREIEAFSVTAERSSPQVFTKRVRLHPGTARVAGAFTNDYWVPDVADRNLAIDAITIAGPLTEDSIRRPESSARLLAPRPERDTVPARHAAARAALERFASRAFRRPVTTPELDRLVTLYDGAVADGEPHDGALRLAMTAVLCSSQFLYRSLEHAPRPGETAPLSAHDLASRLSYFLWSSTPDDELLDAAADGSLTEPGVLIAQTRRLLDDPRSGAFVENFAGQWLLLRNLEALPIDHDAYPELTPALRASMAGEPTMLFDEALRHDLPISSLLRADHTFVDGPLAALYGFAGLAQQPPGDFVRVDLPADSSRGGVLTTAAVLTLTSNPARTSPVKRGLYVLDQILGSPPPPPPPDIPRLEVAAEHAGPNATLRQQLSAHLTEPGCASCHRRMDPIGLALEHFDAIGRYRDADASGPIDASGTLPGGRTFVGADELKSILYERRDRFAETLTRKLLIYALGRGLEPFDRPTVSRVLAETEARSREPTVRAIVEQIVLSKAFRTARAPETSP